MAERYPQTPASTNAALAMQLRKLEQDMRDMRSNLLRAAGLQAEPDLLRVLGSLVVAGSQEITGTLNVTGDAVFDGDLAVPNGSITNDALANPLSIVPAPTVTETSWTTSTSFAAKASTTITVPSGFSSATVIATANVHFQDSSPNSVYIRATISGSNGSQMGGLANLNIGVSASHSAPFTGLVAGGTITVSCDVLSGVASAVTTGRIAQIAAVGFFTR